MSNYIAHLDREWAAKGWPTKGDDDPQVWMYRCLRALLETFGGERHSGSSAPYAVGLFKKLALFEPLGPLTGADEEWVEVAQEDGKPLYQNLRCSHVFKVGEDAHDNDGRVFEEPDGSRFTSSDSRVPVTFPYTPTTEIVKVEASSPERDGAAE